MRLIINASGIFLENQRIEDTLAAAIVKRGRIAVKELSPERIIVDLKPSLETPGLWKLPYTLLRKFYLIPLAFMLMSCSSVYWENSKQTASGKHRYYTQGWGYYENCTTYSQQPIKPLTFKRYSYWRFNR